MTRVSIDRARSSDNTPSATSQPSAEALEEAKEQLRLVCGSIAQKLAEDLPADALACPRSAAVAHECGHAIVGAYNGLSIARISIKEIKSGVWGGETLQAQPLQPGPAMPTQTVLAYFTYLVAGRTAECLFDPENLREGSCFEELVSVVLGLTDFMNDRSAEFTKVAPVDMLKWCFAWATQILQHNEDVTRELMAKLDASGEVKGKPLQAVLRRVQQIPKPTSETGSAPPKPQVSSDQGATPPPPPKPPPKPLGPSPKPEQQKPEPETLELPLIAHLGTRLWGPPQIKRIEPPFPKRYHYHFANGTKIVDPNKDRWFDTETNRGGNLNDLMKMLEAPETLKITAEPYEFPNETDIPLREFLYGKHLLRGTVSITAGIGGGGKSSKTIVETLAMTTGKRLLRVMPLKKLRVMMINLEENRAELDRRIVAAMKHYELSSDDIGGRLFTKAKGEISFKVAAQSRAGLAEPDEATINTLIELVRDNQIDVLIIDPLRKSHRVSENDNVTMGEVIECYDRIAEGAQCAVYLVHHVRKGNNGETTIDSLRGASSLVDAPRSVEIVETMTEGQEDKFDIEPGKRRSYFRTFNGKRNYAPPDDESDWFRFKNVSLDNDDGYGGGDDVGVVTPWTPPEVTELLTPENVSSIKQLVREGKWREDVRADMWVGKPIAQVTHLDHERDKNRIKELLSQLLKDEVLVRRPGFDDKSRPRTFIEINNVNV